MRANTPSPAGRFARRAATLASTAWLAAFLLLSASGHAQVISSSSGSGAPATPVSLAQGPATGAISGLVVDATGAPIAGALVFLSVDGMRAAPGQSRQLTDELGRFAFVNLPPSQSYSVSASRPGFRDGLFGVPESEGPSAPIAIGPGEWFSKARVSLSRAPVITGVITDERGEPIVNAYVRALGQAHIAGRVYLVAGPLTTTDDRGGYRLPDLVPGRYIVQVPSVQGSAPAELSTTALAGMTPQSLATYEASGRTPPSEFTMSFDVSAQVSIGRYPTPPAPASGRWRVFPITFFPGTSDVEQAAVIDLRAGEQRTADLRLTPVATGRVSGFVQGPPESLVNLTLRLLPAGLEDLGVGSEAATSLVRADGSFTFVGIPAGTYIIDAPRTVSELTSARFTVGPGGNATLPRPLGPSGSSSSSNPVPGAAPGTSVMVRDSRGGAGSFAGHTPVVTDAADVTGVVVPMRPLSTLSGWTVFDTAARATPAAPSYIEVYLDPADGSPRLGRPRANASAGSGDFVIEDIVPGRYFVRARGTGWLVKSVQWNGRDVADEPIDTASVRQASDVTVTLTNAVPTLAGTVQNGEGLPAAGATIIAFPVESERWSGYGQAPRRIKTTSVATNGTFQLNTLPAGDYFVVAVPATDRLAWQDPAYLRRMSALATRVHLAWGETATQTLRLAGDAR